VAFNPASVSKVLVRATNWLGDAIMSLPAIRAAREVFPHAHLAVVARPWVAGVYARERSIDRVIPYTGQKGIRARREFAAELRREGFELAILLQNAFDAALITRLAGIPQRIGYNRDGRGLLLTHAIDVPETGEIPRHERFYYLELLRRAGLIDRYPETGPILLEGRHEAREAGMRALARMGIAAPAIGVSPGAAYGGAKRWLPERFAEAAFTLAREWNAAVLVLGSASERACCEEVAEPLGRNGVTVCNLAGQTNLESFIDLAAASRLFLTNDSGAMHVVSALGVPTVAVFGATDDTTTGPAGPLARVVREHAECSPCLLRECPIDHRCMTRVTADRVASAALRLWEESAPEWIPEAKS
jgi:heptosyltransferase-2